MTSDISSWNTAADGIDIIFDGSAKQDGQVVYTNGDILAGELVFDERIPIDQLSTLTVSACGVISTTRKRTVDDYRSAVKVFLFEIEESFDVHSIAAEAQDRARFSFRLPSKIAEHSSQNDFASFGPDEYGFFDPGGGETLPQSCAMFVVGCGVTVVYYVAASATLLKGSRPVFARRTFLFSPSNLGAEQAPELVSTQHNLSIRSWQLEEEQKARPSLLASLLRPKDCPTAGFILRCRTALAVCAGEAIEAILELDHEASNAPLVSRPAVEMVSIKAQLRCTSAMRAPGHMPKWLGGNGRDGKMNGNVMKADNSSACTVTIVDTALEPTRIVSGMNLSELCPLLSLATHVRDPKLVGSYPPGIHISPTVSTFTWDRRYALKIVVGLKFLDKKWDLKLADHELVVLPRRGGPT